MLNHPISKETVALMSRELERRFSLAILKLGLQDQQQARVVELHQGVHLLLKAKVRGDEICNVTIDPDVFSSSVCTCDQKKDCRHVAAVFFELYAQFADPGEWLSDVAATRNMQDPSLKAATRSVHTESAISAHNREPYLPYPSPDSFVHWRRYAESMRPSLQIEPRQLPELYTSYFAAHQKLLAQAAQWSSPVKQLYGLYILLFLLHELDKHYNELKKANASAEIRAAADLAAHFQKLLTEHIGAMNSPELFQRHPTLVRELTSFLHDCTFITGTGLVSWLDLYRPLWTKIFQNEEWRVEERSRLHARLRLSANAEGNLTEQQEAALLGFCHLEVLGDRDDYAISMLNQLSQIQISSLMPYPKRRFTEQRWESLFLWLRFLLPRLKRAPKDAFSLLLHYWQEAVKHGMPETELRDALMSLLPRSYYYYTAYLIRTKQFKAWANFHLLNRISPDHLNVSEIRIVETERPELLLPIYHQATEKCIFEKQRTSYRLAVKYIICLKRLYARLNEQEQFEEYLSALKERHARLRAFFEELKKGKIY